jgi:hypothetical protein
VRVGKGDVSLGADHGQRAAQLVAGVGDEALARGERARHRAELAAREVPAHGGGDQRRPGEREQVAQAQLGERGGGVIGQQRAIEMARHQPVGGEQQERREDDEDPAVEGGEADAQVRDHNR